MNDKTITEKSFDGPLTAIFFGFTNCPDICPMTLYNLDLVINELEIRKKENKVVIGSNSSTVKKFKKFNWKPRIYKQKLIKKIYNSI